MATYKYFKNFVGQVIDDEKYAEMQNEIKKLEATLMRLQFSLRCMQGLSKRDYGRAKYTENLLENALCNLKETMSKTQYETMEMNIRKERIAKALYPMGITVEQAIRDIEEVKKYYETGVYTTGGFVDKHIATLYNL